MISLSNRLRMASNNNQSFSSEFHMGHLGIILPTVINRFDFGVLIIVSSRTFHVKNIIDELLLIFMNV